MSCGLRDENDSGKRSLVRSRNERSHPDSSVELVGSTMNNRLRKRDTQAVPRQKERNEDGAETSTGGLSIDARLAVAMDKVYRITISCRPRYGM
jgi:hypothetical protein